MIIGGETPYDYLPPERLPSQPHDLARRTEVIKGLSPGFSGGSGENALELDVVVIWAEPLDDSFATGECVDGESMSAAEADRLRNFEVLEIDRAELDGRIQQGYAYSIVHTLGMLVRGLER
jgi:hypothetical protein